ncbi:hypothetical protein BCR35DRAFT_299108 [Leucosporidium creatinivorum]|uniref:UNC-45/Cro1/She4 central domain-containing protein n=1 Tax=Leucosporidium creatinivorum TaxID=106004 RepID=A0A1Y2G321_9BASI|nr:hypothetical protein BCR35DRAFT_299108 [Leucosporidium creatinivorum]
MAEMTSSGDGSSLQEQLKAILARSAPLSLNKEDLHLILPALIPSSAPSERTLSLALLARALTPSPTKSTLDSLRTAIEGRLAGTDSTDLVVGLSTLSAVLQVAPPLAVTYLKEGAVRENLEEAVEFITGPTTSKESKRGGERLALVELLSLAAGQSALRAQIGASAAPWLESVVGEPSQDVLEKDVRIATLAAVGIVKLRLGTEKPEEGGSAEGSDVKDVPSRWTLPQLAVLFVKLFIAVVPSPKSKTPVTLESSTSQTLLGCLEGMAYLTLVPSPTIKPAIATGPLLDALLGLLPATTPPSSSNPLDFAVATLLDHLTAFPPPVDSKGDAAQINRLKAFASAKQNAAPPKPELTSSVTTRVSLVVSHSPLPTLRQLCLSPSLACRRLAARITLSLVTPTTLRGTLLQGGIARFAVTLIRQIPTPFNPTEDVFAVQALAKLLITTNPLLVLGPSVSSPLLAEGINALTLPLAVANEEDFGGGTGLLVKFECLMALTNIASLDADVVAGIKLKPSSDSSTGRKLLPIVEELMLSSNTMVRRAATELMCNLVASQPGFDHYAATPFPPNPRPTDAAPPPTSHLHLLIALASSPDPQTRLAASGALTSLAMEPTLALSLALYPRGLEILLALVAEEDQDGLRHRAYDILRSVANGVGAANDAAWKERGRKGLEEAGVKKALKEAVEGKEKVVELREVAKEALVAME